MTNKTIESKAKNEAKQTDITNDIIYDRRALKFHKHSFAFLQANFCKLVKRVSAQKSLSKSINKALAFEIKFI